MDQEIDEAAARRNLEDARRDLRLFNIRDSEKDRLSPVDEFLSGSDPMAAFRELERLGEESGAGHNFWSKMSGAAHLLGLAADEDRCRAKSDLEGSRSIRMPANCRGLPIIDLLGMGQACLIILTNSG
jgi:hypothetical protein